jgi:low temperature requirement protein LtrA
LFFDLVFVFAVTQLSHLLMHHFSPAGALQTLLLCWRCGGCGFTPPG